MIVVTGCRDALASKGIDLTPHEGGEVDVTAQLAAFLPTMTGWSYRFGEDDLTIYGPERLGPQQQAKIDSWGVLYTVGPDPA